MLCLDDVQHLGDNGAGEAGVDEGKVGQKEVHGSVELRVWAKGQDDEHVPQHSDQVHGQEEPKQERLLIWVWREAQEQEVRDAGSVSNVLLN